MWISPSLPSAPELARPLRPHLLVMKEAIVFDLDWINPQYFSFWSSWKTCDLCCVCRCTDSCIMMRAKTKMQRDASLDFSCDFPKCVANLLHKSWTQTMSMPTAQLCSAISDSRPPQPVGHPAWLHLSLPLMPSFSIYKAPDALRSVLLTTGHDSHLEGRLSSSSSHLQVSLATRLRNSFGPIM